MKFEIKKGRTPGTFRIETVFPDGTKVTCFAANEKHCINWVKKILKDSIPFITNPKPVKEIVKCKKSMKENKD